MENAVGDGAGDLGFVPFRMAVAEADGEKLAHGAVDFERTLQTLDRRHRSSDRELAFMRQADVIGFGGEGRGAKLALREGGNKFAVGASEVWRRGLILESARRKRRRPEAISTDQPTSA